MRRLLVFAVLLVTAAAAHAQSTVPAPEAVLGYRIGERFTPHARIEAYYEAVAAAAPDRVRIERYGETYEKRPLFVAYVASPRNLARLDEIRAANLVLASGNGAEAPADLPAIVWMSYNVHGNEASASEAAILTLHALAGGDARAAAWLEDVVVILDPCINPDGHDRYVNGVNALTGLARNAGLEAREHREPWPGGRPNHYLFDLNRDWAWGTQQETRQRVALYKRWMPHVHGDYHEQGFDEPYYFAPAAEPFHPAITAEQRALQVRIGQGNAATFDARGLLYFTRERFDLFYPAYGDTWPIFHGAAGMTFEQGGSGRAGLAIETAAGDTLTLAARAANHLATSLNNVAVASAERGRIVRAFGDYFASARRGDDASFGAYVVRASNPPAKLAALRRVLDHNGVAYGYAARAASGDGYRYADGETGRVTAEPGDLVVPARQANGRMARVLFEPEAPLTDSVTYDITAWALPFAHGLDAVAVRADVPLGGAAPAAPAPFAAAGRAYAYALPWTALDDARFLTALHRAGVRVRTANAPFEQNGRTFAAGTLVVTRADNARLGDGFDAAVEAAARAASVRPTPLATGYAAVGADLGSGNVAPLRAPRVLVMAGDFASSNAVGELWHFFDEALGYPATLAEDRDVTASTLARYDVVVMPAGNYGRILTDAKLLVFRAWIEAGGTLVALESAAGALVGKEGFGLTRKAGAETPRDTLGAYGERERREISGSVPGAVYRVTLDPTHPLAFGYDGSAFALLRSDAAYAYLGTGWNVGTVRGADARVAGFAGRRAQGRLRDVLLYGVEDRGAGHVVYLADSPLFRGFWQGGQLIFANAVFRFVR